MQSVPRCVFSLAVALVALAVALVALTKHANFRWYHVCIIIRVSLLVA